MPKAQNVGLILEPRCVIQSARCCWRSRTLGDGASLPVTVFQDDDNTLWLADGYHRWHGHKAFGATEIEASLRAGNDQDALRFSLGANARSGKSREKGDCTKAYRLACHYNLVDPADPAAVQALLNCSSRTAYDLTVAARAEVEAKQDAEIARGEAEGKSNREIAREVGVAEGTVRNRTKADAQVLHSAETTHPDPEPPLDPRHLRSPAVEKLRDMVSECGERWWAVYRALQAIEACATVDELLADRYPGIKHSLKPPL